MAWSDAARKAAAEARRRKKKILAAPNMVHRNMYADRVDSSLFEANLVREGVHPSIAAQMARRKLGPGAQALKAHLSAYNKRAREERAATKKFGDMMMGPISKRGQSRLFNGKK